MDQETRAMRYVGKVEMKGNVFFIITFYKYSKIPLILCLISQKYW